MEEVLGVMPRLVVRLDFRDDFSLIINIQEKHIQEKLVFYFDEFQNFSRVNPELLVCLMYSQIHLSIRKVAV